MRNLQNRRAIVPVAIGIALSIATAPGSAQQPQVSRGGAVLRGVAIDSLRGGFLREATVVVSGTARMGITDSLGRFRIEGVPPGVARVEVMHPALDTIGMVLVTPDLVFDPGDSVSVIVAMPSATTIVSRKCSPAERAQGPGALFGQVLDAESDAPAIGAQVSVSWTDILIAKKTLRRSQVRRSGTVGSDGLFRICGLPDDIGADVQATNGIDSTSAIGVALTSTVATVGLYLSRPDARATPVGGVNAPGSPIAAITGLVTMHGRVTTKAGAGIGGARVSVDVASDYAMTAPDGSFTLAVRPGTRRLFVRKLGFAPVELPVAATRRNRAPLTIALVDAVPVLATVEVTARLRERGLSRVGFSDRQKRGTGAYLDLEQIERRRAHDLVSLLANLGGIRVEYFGGRPVLMGRARGMQDECVSFFLDGMFWRGGGVENFLMPQEVAAIEVYNSPFIPAEFEQNECSATVVLWTKWKVGVR